MEMSFKDDFWNRYAGADGGSPDKDAMVSAQRELRDMQVDLQRRAVRDQDFADTVYSVSRDELLSDAPEGTAAGAAMSYDNDVAEMKSLADAGQFTRAYQTWVRLTDNADRFRKAAIDRSQARPRTPDEQFLNQRYLSYASNAFQKTEIALPDGGKLTAQQLFADGQEYKKYEADPLARAGFSADVSSAYRSGDPDKMSVVSLAVDPVLGYGKTPAGTATPHPYRMQYQTVADHVVRNYDAYVNELGVEGLRLLVSNATDKAFLNSGTSMDYIRNAVAMLRAKGGEAGDIRSGLAGVTSEILRVARRVSGQGEPDESQMRFASTLVSSVVDSDPTVDFDSVNVRAAVDELSSSIKELDRLRVPVVALAANGSVPVKKDIAEFVNAYAEGREPSAGNFFRRLPVAVGLVDRFLSGGADPVEPVDARRRMPDDPSSYDLGSTTGKTSLDDARRLFKADFLSAYVVPGLAQGLHPDEAMHRVFADPVTREGAEVRLASAIESAMGVGDVAARAVATEALSTAFSLRAGQGGMLPLDIMGAVEKIAFSKDTNHWVSDALHRWMATEGEARHYVSRYDSEQAALYSDPVVGYGIKDNVTLRSVIQHNKMRYVAMMREGKDPRQRMKEDAQRGHWWVPTGRWLLADGAVVTDAELKSGRYVREGKTTGITQTVRASAFPEFSQRAGDLDMAAMGSIVLAGYGKLPAVAAGSWSNPALRTIFRQQQSIINEAMAERARAVNKATAGMLKEAAQPEG